MEEGENRTLVGDWLDGIWDDLKEPVRNAGQGGQLNTFPELSVAFWRWAIWKIFEAENAPRRGVVAFISNRKFLTGWPYSGLRKMMRERFDRIEIIDLRGDVRLGVRAGVQGDQGVFNIMVGTAITLAIADGTKADGELASIHYYDSWSEGRFSRRAKLDWLKLGAELGTLGIGLSVERDLLEDMRPRPFQNGEWVDLKDCFEFASSGLESKRDHVVYAASKSSLEKNIKDIISVSPEKRDAAFNSTSMNSAHRAQAVGWGQEFVRLSGYRPLDRRWHYAHDAWNDRPRPTLRTVWGADNICLFCLPSGTRAGPATWCFSNYPDRHAFRGSYGGYAFPLYDRRQGSNVSNLSPGLIESLSAAYGVAVVAEDIFDAILCLLSATSYTLRFAEDLEDVFPHIPFPAQHSVFESAALVGREIRAVETFARQPGERYRRPDFVRIATQPHGVVSIVEYADGEITLCSDGSGRITGLPQAIWSFAVSGYRLLPRWIEARAGLPADLSFVRELRDICGRIVELIDLFAQADIVLEATLHETLIREALGLEPTEQNDDG